MNLTEIQNKYNTQEKCLSLLEEIRWNGLVICPYCDSEHTRITESERGRHSCKNCNKSFTVFIDTIFEDTHLPLPKWFMAISLALNSKMGISAKALQRHLGLTYKTAYYTLMRIRIGMLMPNTELNGIIEMDESYFGGKPRKEGSPLPKNRPSISTNFTKRGRGTSKISVAGMVERGGAVKTKVLEKLTKRNLLAMLRNYATSDESLLMTDSFPSYKAMDSYIERLEVNHSKQFSKGMVHINTIEGFWSYVKNGIRGNYRAISPKYLPLYLVQYEYLYSTRNDKGNQFKSYLKNALSTDKQLEHWKAESPAEVKQIAYPKKTYKRILKNFKND